ncbi:MAG TPA: DUF3617 domain-containing protein [Usitatibacter sp.]|jgi:hypothetical protein|nr:DUF3617 domain-containing protein [Usitatibacter sp.]
MKPRLTAVAIAASAAFALAAHAADNPFEAFKGKVKPGLYEYKMDMDMGNMPGMPPGMGKQSHTMQHCVTQEDVQKGDMGAKDRNGKGMSDKCQVQDMHVSGNTATYKMVCKGGPDMTVDNKVVFRPDGYTMDMTMDMADHGGRGGPTHMKQHVDTKYIGPCSGR